MSRQSIIDALRTGPRTKYELAKAVGLDPSTVANTLQRLVDDGVARLAGTGPSRGRGPSPWLYALADGSAVTLHERISKLEAQVSELTAALRG